MTPPEVYIVPNTNASENGPNWRVRVVPNKYPALRIEGELNKQGDGIYDQMNGVGAHEVIIESPEHFVSLGQLEIDIVQDVVEVYKKRLHELKKDDRFIFGMLFKNVGATAGASVEHTHSQLIMLPTVPKLIKEEMSGCETFFNYRGRCLYCDMIHQEQQDGIRKVMENEHFYAFCPFASRFPFETWILPRQHESHSNIFQRKKCFVRGNSSEYNQKTRNCTQKSRL